MKNMSVCAAIAFALSLLTAQSGRSQGTVYVSSLGQPSSGSSAVGSDSWQADPIITGNNPGGYVLDSIQLAMIPGSGAPNDFSVMIYSGGGVAFATPGSFLGSLTGSTDPVTGGDFTYSSSGLPLQASSTYFIVLTAGTSVANGAYAWSLENTSPAVSTGGWTGGYSHETSSDGLSWNFTSDYPQFSVTATTVPEPETLYLIRLPGLLFAAWRRWRANAQAR